MCFISQLIDTLYFRLMILHAFNHMCIKKINVKESLCRSSFDTRLYPLASWNLKISYLADLHICSDLRNFKKLNWHVLGNCCWKGENIGKSRSGTLSYNSLYCKVTLPVNTRDRNHSWLYQGGVSSWPNSWIENLKRVLGSIPRGFRKICCPDFHKNKDYA